MLMHIIGWKLYDWWSYSNNTERGWTENLEFLC